MLLWLFAFRFSLFAFNVSLLVLVGGLLSLTRLLILAFDFSF